MGLAASQARLLALQTRKDTQDTKEFLNAINLSSSQKEVISNYNKATTSQNVIQDKAEISDEALKMLENDFNNVRNAFNDTIADSTTKANFTEAKAIKAYKQFAS